MTAPLFSIILPTRDRPYLFRRALASVLRQSYQHFELIAIDDGSEISYADRVCQAAADRRLKTIKCSTNGGVAAARNRGIAGAAGQYISFLDDDDEYEEHFLRETCSLLSSTPDYIAGCWCVPEILAEIEYASDRTVDQQVMSRLLMSGAGCGLTLKRECLNRIGPFNEAFGIGEDTELFARLLSHGYSALSLPGQLIKVHKDANKRLSDSATYRDRLEVCQWIRLVYAEFLAENPDLRRALAPDRISRPFG